MNNSYDEMSRKEKRFSRVIALKAIYAYEFSIAEPAKIIEIIRLAIENGYEELDRLIEYYSDGKNFFIVHDSHGKKLFTREEKIDFLKEKSSSFEEKYLDWYDWSIVDKIDEMPSGSVISYSKRLVCLATENQEKLDKLIIARLKNWEMKRVSLIDKLILRLGISEMLYEDSVPPKVSIVEGVEIAKIFSTDDSSRFVNGILDSVYNDSLNGLIKIEK